MEDSLFLLLLIVVGIISGFLNVMAGGGSAISLPLLIFLGLDSPLANGTNRLAIFIQTIASILSFKQEKLFEFKTSLKFAAFALPGAIAGAVLAVKIDSILFQRVLAFFILGILLTVIIPRSKKNRPHSNCQAGTWLVDLPNHDGHRIHRRISPGRHRVFNDWCLEPYTENGFGAHQHAQGVCFFYLYDPCYNNICLDR